MMIPFHYFLILIALLVSLSGCTQKAPPGSIQAAIVNNSDQHNNDKKDEQPAASPTAIPAENKPTTSEPTEKPIGKTADFSLAAPSAQAWRVVVGGTDAKKLYELLAVTAVEGESKAFTKKGVHMTCSSANEDYSCVLDFSATGGKLTEVVSADQLQKAAATSTLSQNYNSLYFELDLAMTTPEVAHNARIKIEAGFGAKIYKELSVNPVASTEVTPEGYKNSVVKKGEYLKCFEEFSVKTNEANYRCKGFFQYDTGAFEKIQ